MQTFLDAARREVDIDAGRMLAKVENAIGVTSYLVAFLRVLELHGWADKYGTLLDALNAGSLAEATELGQSIRFSAATSLCGAKVTETIRQRLEALAGLQAIAMSNLRQYLYQGIDAPLVNVYEASAKVDFGAAPHRRLPLPVQKDCMSLG